MNDTPSFSLEMEFEYGVAKRLSPLIRRVVANNPGKMTFKGTNSYIIGNGDVAIIDPGPDDQAHIDALVRAVSNETVSHIFLTHTHRDHSGALSKLRDITGAETCGYGQTGRPRGFMSADGGAPMRQFVDTAFAPDRILRDGDRVAMAGWTLSALHTPGHAPDHLCFSLAEEHTLFTGDHVFGWNTSIIGPPEGNMRDYIAALEKLLARDDRLYWPGHGGRITQPQRVVKAYILHRRWREASILQCLKDGLGTVDAIVLKLYRDIDEKIRPAAALSVLAQLEYMVERGIAHCDGSVALDAEFSAT